MDILKTAAVLSLMAAPAAAHVTVQPQQAQAGAYQVLRFGLGHGCDAKPTTSLTVVIPEGVVTARPQPKPGWRLLAERAGERVSAVRWTGHLPADQFDEFLILVKLPAGAGPLAFPAIQTCGATEVRWDQPLSPGRPRPKHPAPVLNLSPVAAAPVAAEHRH